MIQQNNLIGPSYGGVGLMQIDGAFGALRPSHDLLSNPEELTKRMQEDGNLYLPGLLDLDRVQAARDAITSKLEEVGALDPSYPRDEAVACSGAQPSIRPEVVTQTPAVNSLLYEGKMMQFLESFFCEEVLHFSYTWLRIRAPGEQTTTAPHCDTVFMGRGTSNLFTTWTPMGHIPYDFGGLMVLEGSHKHHDADMDAYRKMDVDTYCTNGPEAKEIESAERLWQSDKSRGFYSEDAVGLQKSIGGRWLGAEYNPGDVLIFGMHTLHAAADNRTNRIRISTDSRYQRASEPADERWVGPNPVGHGVGGKKGLIC